MSDSKTLRQRWVARRRDGHGRKAFWLLVVVAALVFLWAAGPGYGQHRRDRQRGAEPRSGDVVAAARYVGEQLDADATQAAEISRTAVTLSDELEVLGVERDRLVAAFDAALRAEQLDARELERLRAEAHDLAGRAVDSSFTAFAGIAATLDPEQRRALADAWGKHR